MSSDVQRRSISVRGNQRVVPVVMIGEKTSIIIRGNFLKIGEVLDEFWLDSKELVEPSAIVEKLKDIPDRPDMFKFSQKVTDVSPKHSFHLEWDNVAVVKIDSYQDWYSKIDRKARQAITKSQRKGVLIKTIPFTDELVDGICSIYNEMPVRQGKQFWHFNKPFAFVKDENSSYLERSIFVGAFYDNELIGFLKIVINNEVASLMQILTKASHYDKSPTNALLSKAVEICESKEVKYLTYGKYIYGKKDHSSLIDFKRHNGFEMISVPCYYVPLTMKGRIALKCGLHKGWETWVPDWIRSGAIEMRNAWYRIRS